MRSASLVVTLILVSAVSARAMLLGMDYSAQDLETKGVLVPGLRAVHGYWVNWEDQFYYVGSTEKLNEFLAAFGNLDAHKLTVVIHPGTGKARSPWDKVDRNLPADWSWYVWNGGTKEKPSPSQVDVWLGSRIRLSDLKIPQHVTIKSGGEIEKFVETHESARKLATPEKDPNVDPALLLHGVPRSPGAGHDRQGT